MECARISPSPFPIHMATRLGPPRMPREHGSNYQTAWPGCWKTQPLAGRRERLEAPGQGRLRGNEAAPQLGRALSGYQVPSAARGQKRRHGRIPLAMVGGRSPWRCIHNHHHLLLLLLPRMRMRGLCRLASVVVKPTFCSDRPVIPSLASRLLRCCPVLCPPRPLPPSASLSPDRLRPKAEWAHETCTSQQRRPGLGLGLATRPSAAGARQTSVVHGPWATTAMIHPIRRTDRKVLVAGMHIQSALVVTGGRRRRRPGRLHGCGTERIPTKAQPNHALPHGDQ